MFRALLLLVSAPACVALAWLSIGGTEPRADLVVASDELRTVDPHRVSWLDEIQVAGALFEGLTRLDPLTQRPGPGVAERWTVSADGRTYTFSLRADARWSNGEPLIAEHFRFAWLRVLEPSVEAQYAGLLFVIDGAEAYYRSRLAAAGPPDASAIAGVGVAAPDDRTLRVRLAAPCPYFLELTAFPTFAPVWPPLLERWAFRGGRALRATQHLWTRPGRIVCNGAFVLEGWDFKRRLLLKRNPHYWDAGGVELRSIEVFVTSDPNTALLGYETGRIDLVRSLQPEVARVLLERQAEGRRHDVHVGDRFATFFLRINTRRPPLDNVELRRALALAIDKAALCGRIMRLGETPADTLVPRGALHLMARPGVDGRPVLYAPPEGLGAGLSHVERVARAREHLSRSGLGPPGAIRPIELAYSSDPPYQQRLAEAIRAMWEAALGLRVDLRLQERKVLAERIRGLDYDVVRSDWYGDYLDPATFLDMFTADNGQNRTGWSNPDYDGLIARAAAEPDPAARFALLAQAERILCQSELPIIPLFFKRGAYLLRPGFGGVGDNPRDVLPIHRIRRVSTSPAG